MPPNLWRRLMWPFRLFWINWILLGSWREALRWTYAMLVVSGRGSRSWQALGEIARSIVFGLAVGTVYVGLVMLLLVLADKALGHDAPGGWTYPRECCGRTDCEPIGPGSREPNPTPGRQGWILVDGTVVPYHLVRPSGDELFHVCRYHRALVWPIPRTTTGACLFVPHGS